MTANPGTESRAVMTPLARLRTAPSVADAVVEEIEAIIARDELPSGHKIGTKQGLAEQFGVAPATLAEALRVLRGRGVIEARPGPGGGLFVANQTPLLRLAHSVLQLRREGAPVNDVIAVLDALDEAVVFDAAKHRTTGDLEDLDRIMGELASVWHDPVRGLHCNWTLHRRIAKISPNAVLRTFYLNLVDYIDGESSQLQMPTASLDVPGFKPDTDVRLRIHFDLVEAIRSQDEDEARRAVLAHRTPGF
ncbi:FadR/GntR family transcriptional regulator [Paenarthrobacter sp. NPDC089714]|uniref:FadR/GntR family transcriptional regulator n=1 Tax=Paenarthrobacter sp. NPDC089714 TaxID=3364377 RepID=UPI0037F78A5B